MEKTKRRSSSANAPVDQHKHTKIILASKDIHANSMKEHRWDGSGANNSRHLRETILVHICVWRVACHNTSEISRIFVNEILSRKGHKTLIWQHSAQRAVNQDCHVISHCHLVRFPWQAYYVQKCCSWVAESGLLGTTFWRFTHPWRWWSWWSLSWRWNHRWGWKWRWRRKRRRRWQRRWGEGPWP